MEWMNIPLVQGGVWTLLGGALIAVFTGRLLPRWYVTQLRESDRSTIERQREEIKEWRDAAHASELANRELMEQVQELMETGRLANQLFRSAVTKGGGVD